MGTFIAVTMINSYYELHPKVTLEYKIEAPQVVVNYSAPKAKKVANIKASNYWDILTEIESKSGKLLYRPQQVKSKSCLWVKNPCGWRQVGYKALVDIGEWTKQGTLDREDKEKSLAQAIKYRKHISKQCSYKQDYLQYLCHNQGATGIALILKANRVKKYNLPKRIIKNMANNSPFSKRTLRKTGGAKKFLGYWRKKWEATRNRIASI